MFDVAEKIKKSKLSNALVSIVDSKLKISVPKLFFLIVTILSFSYCSDPNYIWRVGLSSSIFYFIGRGVLKLPSGALSCIYLIFYGLGRIRIEPLRTDPLCLGGLPPFCEGGIRIAQLISFLMICLGSFGLYWIYQSKRKMPSFGIISKRRR